MTPFSKSLPARTDFLVTVSAGQNASGGVFKKSDRRGVLGGGEILFPEHVPVL
jgi:hypothetical protein